MSLFELDRHVLEWINHNRFKPLDNIFIWITDTAYMTALLMALIVLMVGFLRKDAVLKRKGWQVLFAFALNSILINVLKYLVNRERPYKHDNLIEKLSTGGSPSFPSGHTADAFLIAVFFSLLFPNKWQVLFPIWLWAIAVAYSRIALGVHYPSDVLGSMFIGALVAILFYNYFKKRKATNSLNQTSLTEKF
jgi:undecaprenyl-diphosphatase